LCSIQAQYGGYPGALFGNAGGGASGSFNLAANEVIASTSYMLGSAGNLCWLAFTTSLNKYYGPYGAACPTVMICVSIIIIIIRLVLYYCCIIV
jgi:hypothetical protein